MDSHGGSGGRKRVQVGSSIQCSKLGVKVVAIRVGFWGCLGF